VELLELGVFGRKNLEWSCFFGSGAVWSSPKHAINAWKITLASDHLKMDPPTLAKPLACSPIPS
jgi:hypothetical protein